MTAFTLCARQEFPACFPCLILKRKERLKCGLTLAVPVEAGVDGEAAEVGERTIVFPVYCKEKIGIRQNETFIK